MHNDQSFTQDPSTTEPTRFATRVLTQLQRAWNAADGTAFAAPFIEAGDFVDIRGELHHGRTVIAAGHDDIFNTIYKGTAVRFELLDARLIAPDCMLIHSRAKLDWTSDPHREIRSTQTMVAVRDGSAVGASESSWRLAAFHNTVRP